MEKDFRKVHINILNQIKSNVMLGNAFVSFTLSDLAEEYVRYGCKSVTANFLANDYVYRLISKGLTVMKTTDLSIGSEFYTVTGYTYNLSKSSKLAKELNRLYEENIHFHLGDHAENLSAIRNIVYRHILKDLSENGSVEISLDYIQRAIKDRELNMYYMCLDLGTKLDNIVSFIMKVFGTEQTCLVSDSFVAYLDDSEDFSLSAVEKDNLLLVRSSK